MEGCLSNIPLPWSGSSFLPFFPEGFAVHTITKPLLSPAWTLPGRPWWWWCGDSEPGPDGDAVSSGGRATRGDPVDTKASAGPEVCAALRCLRPSTLRHPSLFVLGKYCGRAFGPVTAGILISIQKDEPRQVVNMIIFSTQMEGCFWNNVWKIGSFPGEVVEKSL